MKRVLSFSLLISMLLLSASSNVLAHGGDDTTDSGNNNDPMMGDDNMMGTGDMIGNSGMMNIDDDGFEGFSQHMTITGDVFLGDSLQLTISANPTDEMNSMMGDHMGSDYNPMSYTNMINLSMTKLVEFQDLNNDGFTADDTIVSEYLINSVNMEDPVVLNQTDIMVYHINSTDGILNVIVDLVTEEHIPVAFKWSFDINYPFVQANTSLAVLNIVETGSMNMMEMRMNNDDQMDNMEENLMHDSNENLPMFFTWEDTYIVDGSTNDVLTSFYDNQYFAISFEQGDNIFYDPKIGYDISSIQTIDGILDGFSFQQFWETMKSPTIMGLAFGLIALVTIFTVSKSLVNKEDLVSSKY